MKWTFAILILTSQFVQAETVSTLFLQGFVPRMVKTSVNRTQKSENQVLWLLTSQINSETAVDEQKFEVEGLDQVGVESVVNKIMTKNRTVQYEILIKQVEHLSNENKPVFLKISAN